MTGQKIAIGFVAITLFVGSMTAHAADISAGYKAYNRDDYATALRIFRQIAEQGDAAAQRMTGIMYKFGQGVPQDYSVAVKWFRKAADQGYDKGQYSLGFMYDYGWSVTQDYVQAHMWYNLAAARGLEIARNKRDSLAEKMTPEQIAEAQKLAREWKPKGK